MANKKNTGVKAPKATEKKAPEQTVAPETAERPQYKVPFISARIERMSTNPNSPIKANASVVIAHHFVVPGFKVYDGGEEKGLRVLNPSSKGNNGNYYDNFYSMTQEGKEAVSKYILEAYEQKLEQTQSDGQADEHTEEELTDEDEEPAFEQTM